jgi:hypothetical protein
MPRNNADFKAGQVPVTFQMSAKDGSWSGSHTFMSKSPEHAKSQATATGYKVEDEGKVGS